MDDVAVQPIAIERIVPGDNDRKVFDETALNELANSIARVGLAEPIVVRPLADGMFQVVAGERRLRAMRDILGWFEAPCIVRAMSDEGASEMMLAENAARKDLNPLEEAQAYRKRIDRFGWALPHLARVAGVSEERVGRRLLLLQLVPEAQALVGSAQLGVAHAECLAPLDANRQRIALRVLQKGNTLPITAWRALINDLLVEQTQDGLFDLEQFWVQNAQVVQVNGRSAVLELPRNECLPRPRVAKGDLGEVFWVYVQDLLAAGYAAEASAVGTLYAALIRRRRLRLPECALRARACPERAANLV